MCDPRFSGGEAAGGSRQTLSSSVAPRIYTPTGCDIHPLPSAEARGGWREGNPGDGGLRGSPPAPPRPPLPRVSTNGVWVGHSPDSPHGARRTP